MDKTEQLEICRTCIPHECDECPYNEFVKKIRNSLSAVDNLAQVNPMNEPYFSKSPCQTCGDDTAGDRFNLVAVLRSNRKERVDFAVCLDCFGYLFA